MRVKKCGCAALIENKRVFLIQRSFSSKDFPGAWGFPGGGQELGDVDLSATAVREALEEVSVTFIPKILIGVYRTPLEDKIVEGHMFVGSFSGSISPNAEVCGYGWFARSDTIYLPLAFQYPSVLADLQDRGYL